MAVFGLQTTLSTNLNLRYSLGSNGGAIGRKVGGASVEVSQKTLKESSFRPADPCSQWERQSRNGCGMQESKNLFIKKRKKRTRRVLLMAVFLKRMRAQVAATPAATKGTALGSTK